MSTGLRRLAVGVALALLAAPAIAVSASGLGVDGDEVDITVTVPELSDDSDEDTGPAALEDAELRWSINKESVSSAYFGGCNFFMAGTPGRNGDSGGSRPWTDGDAGLYRAAQGDVRILRQVGEGKGSSQRKASFATRCTAPDGSRVSTGGATTTGAEIVVDGGTGERRADGAVKIAWKGTFTVVYYGGMTYWWASDPVLTLDAAGNGTLTATGGGFASDRDDSSVWRKLKATPVTLARFTGEKVRSGGDGAFLTPDYCRVAIKDAGFTDPQYRESAGDVCWGSFPQRFVDFQQRTGQGSYWYSSGGAADRNKVPTDVAVSFDAANSIGSAPDDDPDADSDGAPGAGPGAMGGTGPGTGTGTAPGTGTGASTGTAPGSGTAAAPAGGLGGPGGIGVRAVPATPAVGGAATAVSSVFPAVSAATLGGGAPPLVPPLAPTAASPGERLAVLTTGLMLSASGAVVGFRKRWLVLPFRA